MRIIGVKRRRGFELGCLAICAAGVMTACSEADSSGTAGGVSSSDSGANATGGAGGAGGTGPGSTVVAFRVNSLALVDPPIFATVSPLCLANVSGAVNDAVTESVTTDVDEDGFIDTNLVQLVAVPTLTIGDVMEAELVAPQCVEPASNTSCTMPSDGLRTATTIENVGGDGVCFAPIAGTTAAGAGVNTPTASATTTCGVADVGALVVGLGGINIVLEDTTMAAEWVGDPATGMPNGVVAGFITQAGAESALLPADVPILGGSPLANSLCAADLDDHPVHGAGWWFYLNFTAEAVPYTE